MPIPTEPIGSIPRPAALLQAIDRLGSDHPSLTALYEEAIRDTIGRFEETGSPVITDGEQRKYHDFWTYAVHELPNTDREGFRIPFADGHARRMPRLTHGPFRYRRYADEFLESARRYTRRPLKQAVISASAMSLLYPAEGLPGYSREEFLEDLVNEHEKEIRRCLDVGAVKVQVDFTEGRFALKVDPKGELLGSFIDLNNLALSRFTDQERERLGVHTCPGGDRDSTHSADVPYERLLPWLFELRANSFCIAMTAEPDPVGVLRLIRDHMRPNHRIFVGVTSAIDPRVETAEEVRDRVLRAAEHIPIEQLGTTDDCGFAPFADDLSTSRDTAFAKIRARVLGTAMASRTLGMAT